MRVCRLFLRFFGEGMNVKTKEDGSAATSICHLLNSFVLFMCNKQQSHGINLGG